MSEKNSAKPVLTGIFAVLILVRLVYFLVRLNAPASTTGDQQLQMLRNMSDQLSMARDTISLLRSVPEKLPVPEKPVLKVKAMEEHGATTTQENNLKGPVKTYKEYSLGAGSHNDKTISQGGESLSLTNDMAFTPLGRQTADRIYEYHYYYDEANTMRFSEAIDEVETGAGDKRRYWYDKNGNLSRAVSYNEDKDSVFDVEIHLYQNEYIADRTIVKQSVFYNGEFMMDEMAVYDLYGNQVYKGYSEKPGESKTETLTEYITINGEQLVKSIYEKKPEGGRVLAELNEYDTEGRVVKKFSTELMGMGDVLIYAYRADGSYTKDFYRSSDKDSPFNENSLSLLSHTVVTCDKQGHEISKDEEEDGAHTITSYDCKYDSHGNCTYRAEYMQKMDAKGKPIDKKELFDMYVYQYTYYKSGQKNRQAIPAESVRFKTAYEAAMKQVPKALKVNDIREAPTP